MSSPEGPTFIEVQCCSPRVTDGPKEIPEDCTQYGSIAIQPHLAGDQPFCWRHGNLIRSELASLVEGVSEVAEPNDYLKALYGRGVTCVAIVGPKDENWDDWEYRTCGEPAAAIGWSGEGKGTSYARAPMCRTHTEALIEFARTDGRRWR